MSTCPFCRNTLTDTDLKSGKCPACKRVLPADKPALGGTLPSGAAPEPPPSEEIAATTDRGDDAGTIPPDAAPEPPPSEEIAASTDRGDDAGTIPPDAAPEPPPAEDDTDDDAGFAQTTDSPALPPSSAGGGLPAMSVGGGRQPPTSLRKSIKEGLHAAISESSLVIQSRAVRTMKEPEAERADYVVIDQIGIGGMGIVYSAKQSSIDRVVAIKKLKPGSTDPEDLKKRRATFLSEAVVTGDLEHPNVVPIYDVGIDEEGELFYSMKRVKGTPWDEAISQQTIEENVDVLVKIADAVAFAHSRDVIHRDLKPENVMLGDFNEVLLMDWGLAMQPSPPTGRGIAGSLPYMAPEMAAGHLERVGTHSDVYLLGAILFEIVAGRPPHTGKSKTDCLLAVKRNEIVSTDRSGELLDIAMKAMATDPKDRYASVEDFQSAIGEYRSHSQSVSLSTRAAEDLAEARQNRDYKAYAQALFGFVEASELWDANRTARDGVEETTLAYADTALQNGDYDLGSSLLDADDPAHANLHKKIKRAERERDTRQQRLKTAKRLAVSLVVLMLIGAIGAAIIIQGDRLALADKNKELDSTNKELDGTNKKLEGANKTLDETNTKLDDTNKDLEVANKGIEDKKLEVEVANIDLTNSLNAEKKLRAELQREVYVTGIGFASAKIEENAFDKAAEVLAASHSQHHWEWRRLQYLCTRAERVFESEAEPQPIEIAALSPDATLVAAAGWSGRVHIWDAQSAEELDPVDTGGQYVFALAFSPDGKHLAIGTDDKPSYVKIWDLETRQVHKQLKGHTDTVLSVVYSGDGTRLLTSSYDATARLWDLETPEPTLMHTFEGYHDLWVWSAAFSADEQQIVTASQDGSAIVWSIEGEPGEPFRGHAGPVYSAAFSPDGNLVVSGGYDGRVLIWNPASIEPLEQDFLGGSTPALAPSISSGMLRRESNVFRSLDGHTGGVRSVRFSSDGKRVLSGSNDNTVMVWSTANGALLRTLRGHGGPVRCCVFAADGQSVLSGSHDQTARIWQLAGYDETHVFGGRILASDKDPVLSPVLGAAFSGDGKLIVSAGRDGKARTWDSDGKPIRTFTEGHDYLVATGLFFGDGRKLLTTARDDTVRVWDVADGTQIWGRKGSGSNAVAALSHDGKWILTGSDDKTPIIWNAEDGEQLGTLPQHASTITAAAISHDDGLLLTGDARGLWFLWDAKTRKLIRQLTGAEHGHTSSITAMFFLPDGKRFLTASNDSTVALWNLETGDELSIFKHSRPVASAALSPVDGKQILTVCVDKVETHREADGTLSEKPVSSAVTLWDVDTAAAIRKLDTGDTLIVSVAFSADGQRAVAACGDNTIRLWDLNSGKEILSDGGPFATVDKNRGSLSSAIFAPGGGVLATGGNFARLWTRAGKEGIGFSPHDSIAAAGFSPDGKHIVTGSWDATTRIWDVQTGKDVLRLEGGHTGPKKRINSAVYSPNGTMILTAADDRTAVLWDARTGNVVRKFEGHAGRIGGAVFSFDGKRVLTASDDKTARIWNAETAEMQLELVGHDEAVLSAAFSVDGKLVITASEDNSAMVWDAKTGRLIHTLKGHAGIVTSVAFSADGLRAITGSEDKTVKIWELQRGEEILTLRGHSDGVTCVAFSPDKERKHVLSGSRDGTLILWPAIGLSEVEVATDAADDTELP